ncbi:MAG: tol-pal system protein YbgF, partial [Fulvivirga sp.]
MRKLLITSIVILSAFKASAVELDSINKSEQIILIADMQLQIDINQAMNDMYNFKFKKAEQEFKYFKKKYGWHPLPYFLLGLSEWWKIMPNVSNKAH